MLMATARDLSNAELLPFLPFVYLAWSDGELADSEVQSIRSEMASTGLSDDCRVAFDEWMDPASPPSADELAATRAVTGSQLPRPPEARAPLDVAALVSLRDGPRHDIRQRLRTLLTDPAFAHEHGLAMADYRARTLTQTTRLADEGIGRLGFPAEHGGTGSQSDFLGAFSVLGHHDLSLLTKFGVQFGLYGGAILRLGTAGPIRNGVGRRHV